MSQPAFALGKLPAGLLSELLLAISVRDDHVLVGPGPGLDCAVLDLGTDTLLVLKSDPITFTAKDLGWYLVQINANDIATAGARPRWLMATLLFPEKSTTEELVRATFRQLQDACAAIDVSIIGGHTEITRAVQHPVAVGTLIGEVHRERLVTPEGAAQADCLLLTKFLPIEAVSILCAEFPARLRALLGPTNFKRGQRYSVDPGISVLRDAQIAVASGKVNAMHDPTEGGLATALWELSDASKTRLILDMKAVPVSPLAQRVCQEFDIEPMAAISSGALLLSVPASSRENIELALESHGIACNTIGRVETGSPGVWYKSPDGMKLLKRPDRDEIARLLERM